MCLGQNKYTSSAGFAIAPQFPGKFSSAVILNRNQDCKTKDCWNKCDGKCHSFEKNGFDSNDISAEIDQILLGNEDRVPMVESNHGCNIGSKTASMGSYSSDLVDFGDGRGLCSLNNDDPISSIENFVWKDEFPLISKLENDPNFKFEQKQTTFGDIKFDDSNPCASICLADPDHDESSKAECRSNLDNSSSSGSALSPDEVDRDSLMSNGYFDAANLDLNTDKMLMAQSIKDKSFLSEEIKSSEDTASKEDLSASNMSNKYSRKRQTSASQSRIEANRRSARARRKYLKEVEDSSCELSAAAIKRMRNTEAARESRKRKAAKLGQLSQEADELRRENSELSRQLSQSKFECESQRTRIQFLEKQVNELHNILRGFGKVAQGTK